MRETSIALVTGANRGIGYAIAEGLVKHGLTVVLAARDPSAGPAAAARLGARPLVLDVTDPASVRAAAAQVDDWYGRLDVLVNNAGIAGRRDAQTPGAVDLDAVREVFETNLFGVIQVTEAFLPLLRRSGDARIVNVSSGTGSLAWMTDEQHRFAVRRTSAGYPVSKSALNMLTVQYAKALAGERIKVNAIAPGACDTDFARGLGLRLERTAEQGAAAAIELATMADAPTGHFRDDAGTVPW